MFSLFHNNTSAHTSGKHTKKPAPQKVSPSRSGRAQATVRSPRASGNLYYQKQINNCFAAGLIDDAERRELIRKYAST